MIKLTLNNKKFNKMRILKIKIILLKINILIFNNNKLINYMHNSYYLR